MEPREGSGSHLKVQPRTNKFSRELSHERCREHTLPKANIWQALNNMYPDNSQDLGGELQMGVARTPAGEGEE